MIIVLMVNTAKKEECGGTTVLVVSEKVEINGVRLKMNAFLDVIETDIVVD